jgi:glyceraldehyde 3-phosphate dehydrogenase
MAVRVAINGFGRIGRLTLRALFESGRDDLEVVAVNDLGPVETNAHLLKYDTVHGPFPGEIRVKGDAIDLGHGPVRVLAERDPARLPWADLGVEVALECTGLFRKRDQAALHLDAGAKRVLISAPAEGADLTVVYGVNHDKLEASHEIVSAASCTTNCLAPVAFVLHRAIGIARGYMTTVHAYTGDQRLVDTLHKDLRRARAAAHSMIPTSTGAARAVGLVLPELKGKLDGCAIRVPVLNVSLVDLTFEAARETNAQEINAAVQEAASGPLAGILAVCAEPLVSADFNHHPASSIFDLTQTQVVDERFARVMAWYDNEWGFAHRMLDTAAAMASLG